jgi:polysaccharide export outer membrane protein
MDELGKNKASYIENYQPVNNRFYLFLFILNLTGCGKAHFDYPVQGASDFVTDSYRIREGKLAILDFEGRPMEELPVDAMDEYKDSIHEDDILNIAVFHPTRKDLIETVRFLNDVIGFRVINGKVDIPDLLPIKVEGLTLDEAKELIQGEFQDQIQDIEVFVTYKDRLARKVDLTGEVALSYIPVDGKIRLYEILSKARVPNSANLFMSYVLRDGKPLAVDLYRLRNKGDMTQNIVMKGGDKVFIASPGDAKVMVMGEVNEPKAIPVPTGYMSLREALVSARGIPYTGDRKTIQVIRGNLLKPKVYVLSWEHIVNLPNDSLLVMPGDTIYVSEKPITKWNRFMSQIFPSFNGLQSGYAAYRMLGPGI